MITTYQVTFVDRKNVSYGLSLLAHDARHAVVSATELIPPGCRVIKVYKRPEWED